MQQQSETAPAEEIEAFHSPELQNALEEFGKSQEKTYSPQLQKILEHIAKTGITCYDWSVLKGLVSLRLHQIASQWKDLNDKLLEDKFQSIFKQLDYFSSAPFTLQRICELVLNPSIYKNPHKYTSALEKLVNVSSTIPQLSPTDYNSTVATLIAQKREVERITRDERVPMRSPSPVAMDTSPFANAVDINNNAVNVLVGEIRPDKLRNEEEDRSSSPMEM